MRATRGRRREGGLGGELLEEVAIEGLDERGVGDRLGGIVLVVDESESGHCDGTEVSDEVQEESGGKERTLRIRAESSREVARLTVHALCVLKHAEEEPRLAEEAVLLRASAEGVALGEGADRRKVVESLKKGVGVRVGDVRLEAGVGSLVVEAAAGRGVSEEPRKREREETYAKSKSSIPNRLYLISTLR